jgi:hypothetical protein
MTRILLLLAVLFPTWAMGQSFIQMDTLINYPAEISAKVKGEIHQVFQVDFTGDSLADFIIRTKMDSLGQIEEVWLTSKFLVFSKTKREAASYDFIGFMNLDNDPEPELYRAIGYSDGIDYAIYNLNMKTGRHELLFYFNPVIIENENDFWGYPWDTKGIITSKANGFTMIYCSIDHDIERDGEITIPENQKVLPVLFLSGQSNQPIPIAEIRNRAWHTLEELTQMVIKN